MKQDAIPYEAGNVLTGQGIRFRLPLVWGLKLPLTIRPLHPGTIVLLSQQVELLKEVEEDQNMAIELLRAGENLAIHCRMVAIGVLNHYLMIKCFAPLLSSLLKWKVKNNEELLAYVSLVYRQMDAERFFFIMTLTQGMNFLKKKTPTDDSKAGIPSGAQSA